ncbi:MAG: AAA family ATPase [Bacillota bacterium]|nr:AAA family ATPase [Bacillota bacterium]
MKEIVAGVVIALFITLGLQGVNITPFILFGLLMGGFYFFMIMQGQMKVSNVGGGVEQKNQLKFEDIGGQDTAIKELKEALDFVCKPEEIVTMGIRPLKGILLVGPPGTGKTLLARAAASFTHSAFVAASGSEFIEIYAGVGAKRVRQLFNDVRKKAQKQNLQSAIIFIDELEILGAKRGSHNSHMEYDQTLNQLLVEMDGVNQNENPRILVIAATNRPDMLDSALLRPGRFDRQVRVDLPDRSGRKKILELHTSNKPLDKGLQLDEIARASFGFSGAHLESLANEAAILAMRENSDAIKQQHFSEAIDKVIMGEKLDRKPVEKEMTRVCVHESGHALVSEILERGSVSSLTIIPRGRALGFMRKSPQDDQYLYTKEELEDKIMVALAGAVAEELRYGNRSTGSRNDFEQAWEVAGDLVKSGLSSLGVMDSNNVPKEKLYEECKKILDVTEQKTINLLKQNQGLLFKIADIIRDEETLDRQRFEEIVYRSNEIAV